MKDVVFILGYMLVIVGGGYLLGAYAAYVILPPPDEVTGGPRASTRGAETDLDPSDEDPNEFGGRDQ